MKRAIQRFSALWLAGILPGCMSLSARTPSEGGEEFAFERHEVVTGFAKLQTVVTGFLLGGDVSDLAVLRIDENGDRRLRLYAFDAGEWTPALEATLRPGVSFVDVAHIGGRDRLITYAPGGLSGFDPESATERTLVAVPSTIEVRTQGAILHVDVTRDVNGDGRDDLVVPHAGGFSVFVQTRAGEFADPVTLGPAFDMSRIDRAHGYRHDPWASSRIHELDWDRDGRPDLVYWNGDRFAVHVQDDAGRFASTTETFRTAVKFDSDDLSTLAAPEGVRGRRMDHAPPGKKNGRVLRALTDMNGDDIADLVVFSLLGKGLWSMHSAYEVYFGAPGPDGNIAFAAEVGAEIRADGIPFGFGRHDVDRDGQMDVTFTTINPGVFKAIGMLVGAIFTGSVSLDLDLYAMESGLYQEKPDFRRKIKTVSFGRSGEKAAVFPSVLIGDVNGDGRSDLLVQKGRKQLQVHLGVPGPRRFDRRPRKLEVAMPKEQYTWLVDLDADGKQDVVLHHPSPIEPDRVTILIAR